jgi:dTDP-4-dehydrorhamnose 3,5-epimerase
MQVNELDIEGAYEFVPAIMSDDRGTFLETFRATDFAGALGHGFDLAQANCSISRRGVIRGIHFADVPPGQAKYVTCVSGEVLDVVIDIRVGSPTFGRWVSVPLDDVERRSVYLAEGLGHAFMALSESATVVYLCSTPYTPGSEHGINALDPSISIDWPTDHDVVLSERDRDAMTLAEAQSMNLLPRYDECRAYVSSLRAKIGTA